MESGSLEDWHCSTFCLLTKKILLQLHDAHREFTDLRHTLLRSQGKLIYVIESRALESTHISFAFLV